MIINKSDKLTANTKIIAQCEICGKQSNTLYKCHKRSISKYGQYRCFKCSVSTKEFSEKAKINSKLALGIQKYGPLSNEIKKKISNSIKLLMTSERKQEISKQSKILWNDQSFRNKVSGKLSKLWENKEIKEKAIIGIKNHIKNNPEFYVKIHTKQWENEEYRLKMSKITSDRMIKRWKDIFTNGKPPIIKGKSEIVNSIKGGIFRTRSSYETAYVKILDNDYNVKEFKYEPFYIDYEHNGIKKIYIPDFLVKYNDGHIELIEVKPLRMINMNINQMKFKAAEEYSITNNMKFMIISEDKLFN